MIRVLPGLTAVRKATVYVCDHEGAHKGQGLLLDLGEDEGAVVLTCHHVIAPVEEENLCVRIPQAGGLRLGDPVPVRYDEGLSRPEKDAVVLRADGVHRYERPLLHKVNLDKYDGSLNATVLTYQQPNTFNAEVGPSTWLHVEPKESSWAGSPDRYELYALRLRTPDDAREGISGGVVLCEEGVLGLVHFGRAEGPRHAMEDYLVPVTVWAEGWPALEQIIDPLIDENLRSLAKIKRVDQLEIGTDVNIAEYRPDVYLHRDVEQQAREALERRGGVIFVGKPKSGKTRLAHHLLQERRQSVVVMPRRIYDPPQAFEASGLATADELVLFFDDLHETPATSDPLLWSERLEEKTGLPCQLVCTARGGANWKQVKDQQYRLLEALGRDAWVFTSQVGDQGRDLTETEGRQLAEQLGLREEEFEKFDGTPGSLTLDLQAMRERYEHMRDDERVGDVPMSRLLDSAKLAYEGTGWSLRRSILHAIANEILGDGRMSDVTWKTLVRRTADEGFGRFDDLGILQVYRPYLEECVTYKPSEEEINLLPPIVLREDETLREAFLMTLKLRKIGGPKAQRVVLRLIETELRQLVEQFQEYSKPGGIEVTEKGVPEWVQVRCWDTMDGHYIGTDSNLPSKYMDILGGYLKSHQRYLERTGRRDSVRTIFAERAVLEQDREAYPETYREFVEWHKDNQVELLFLSRSRAEELAEAHTTNGVTDMAYWDGELILLWRYMGNDRVRLQMSFIGEDLYRRCRSFLDAVANEAELFPGADG